MRPNAVGGRISRTVQTETFFGIVAHSALQLRSLQEETDENR